MSSQGCCFLYPPHQCSSDEQTSSAISAPLTFQWQEFGKEFLNTKLTGKTVYQTIRISTKEELVQQLYDIPVRQYAKDIESGIKATSSISRKVSEELAEDDIACLSFHISLSRPWSSRTTIPA
jgi:hypothetical protein